MRQARRKDLAGISPASLLRDLLCSGVQTPAVPTMPLLRAVAAQYRRCDLPQMRIGATLHPLRSDRTPGWQADNIRTSLQFLFPLFPGAEALRNLW